MKSFLEELNFPKDFLFQILSLFVCILVVHTFYLLFIDPAATFQVIEAANLNKAPERTLAIILKDFEQEVCIMFFFATSGCCCMSSEEMISLVFSLMFYRVCLLF